METLKQKRTGWVVTSECGTYLLGFTFYFSRSGAIRKFKEYKESLGEPVITWRGYYRRGHRCLPATQTTIIDTGYEGLGVQGV